MLEILLRDDRYVAIHKPSGMLVHRSSWCPREPACLEILRDQLGRFVYPIHRLDRATSGIVLFALDSEAAARISTLFREQRIHKNYLAVVRGFLDIRGRFDDPLKRPDGKTPHQAVTDYRREAIVELSVPVGRYQTGRYSLIRLWPHTGRHHQIRRHLAHASHPIIGDTKHGDRQHNLFFRESLHIHRLLLMATDLSFVHPFNERLVHIHAPMPEEVETLFSQLGWPIEYPSHASRRPALLAEYDAPFHAAAHSFSPVSVRDLRLSL